MSIIAAEDLPREPEKRLQEDMIHAHENEALRKGRCCAEKTPLKQNSSRGARSSESSTEARNVAPAETSEYSVRSWKVLVGALCLTIPTFGLTSTIGLFQTYWQRHQLTGLSATDISWIISIYGFLSTFLSFLAGILYDQFSFPDVVAFGVVDQWFKKSHPFAVGFVTIGAPVGGIFFSLVLNTLFERYSWKLAMAILTSILASFLLLGALLVEPKKLPGCRHEEAQFAHEGSHTSRASTSIASRLDISQWTFLRSRKFYLFSYTVFVFEFVLYAQWGSLPAYAVYVGLGNQFYIQMTYNIGAIITRALPPYLATRWGSFNVSLGMMLFTTVVMFGVWIPSGDSSAVALYAVAFLVGLGTGSFTPLAASCISELCGGRGYGKWIGGCYTISSFALLISNPVTQKILNSLGPKLLVSIMGSVLFTGFCTCLAVRWLRTEGRWTWKERV
ncbi:major facilitator superfamily domain-containing protein [Xylariaceae sp. FL0016]|nr:major facilitator superfamily domain-containing protein [Xylariaceae sp. FL0016]